MDDEEAKPLDLDTISLLIPQVKAGSNEARDDLVRHIQSYLALMAGKNNVQHLQAKFGNSDIVQQSLAQVVQGFDQFRGETSKEFYGWLNQIVANEAKRLQRDHHRQKRDVARERQLDQYGSHAVIVPLDGQPTPGTSAMAQEEMRQLADALDSLPEDYAEVVRLRSLESLPFQQVAQKMNRSVDSVRKIWYRAIVKLQQEVESRDPGHEKEP